MERYAPFLVLLFPLYWMGIMFIASRIGGWNRLAGRFAERRPWQGTKFGGQSVSIVSALPSNYGGITTITVGDDGFGMRLNRLFGFGHQPLQIPWRAVADAEQKKRLWSTYLEIKLREPGMPTVLVSGKAAEAIFAGYEKSRHQ